MSEISEKQARQSFGSSSPAPVDGIGDRFQIDQQPALRTVDRGHVEALFEVADIAAVGSDH